MKTETQEFEFGVIGRLVAALICAIAYSATFFVIGWAFDSNGFIVLGKIAAVIGVITGLVHE